MASCPPPDPNLAPPPIALVKFLSGGVTISGLNFYNPKHKNWNAAWMSSIPLTPKSGGTSSRTSRGTTVREQRYDSVEAWIEDRQWPEARAVLHHYLARCKQIWKNVNDSTKVERMIGRGAYDWALTVGPNTGWWLGKMAALPPKPGETVGAYRKRGGFLLSRSMADGRVWIDYVEPSWVDKHNTQVEGFRLYITAMGPHSITIRAEVVAPGALNRLWDHIVNLTKKFCHLLTGDKLMTAAATAAAFAGTNPKVAVAVAAYAAAAGLCNLTWPACDAPTEAPTGAESRTPRGRHVGPVPFSTQPAYPEGTIAFVTRGGAVRIAVPIGLAGFGPTHVEVTAASTVPSNARVVSWLEWNNATQPLWRRAWFLGVLGAGAAATTTALALRRR